MYTTKEEKVNYDNGIDAPLVPEFASIIESLRAEINHYDDIVTETKIKLDTIKINTNLNTKENLLAEKEPESVSDEIKRLINRLMILNGRAMSNLNHLRTIV